MSFHYHVQTTCGGHPASYSAHVGALCVVLAQLELESDDSPPTSLEVENQ
jgi:acid phosphatase family membrane protein YuiD